MPFVSQQHSIKLRLLAFKVSALIQRGSRVGVPGTRSGGIKTSHSCIMRSDTRASDDSCQNSKFKHRYLRCGYPHRFGGRVGVSTSHALPISLARSPVKAARSNAPIPNNFRTLIHLTHPLPHSLTRYFFDLFSEASRSSRSRGLGFRRPSPRRSRRLGLIVDSDSVGLMAAIRCG